MLELRSEITVPVHFKRRTSLHPRGNPEEESWEVWEGETLIARFPVEVFYSKPLDVLGLKGMDLKSHAEYVHQLQESAARLFGQGARLDSVEKCPCCTCRVTDAPLAVEVWGATYRTCHFCGHVFLSPRPTTDRINRAFSESELHAQVYTDPSRANLRIEQIVRPKLSWIQGCFERLYGRRIHSLVDVGAGGGHFVAGALREGITASGYEISGPARRFAYDTFGIQLERGDFLSASPVEEPDVVTFWGLLEYTPDPACFVAQAWKWLGNRGLLVFEVPRFNSVSGTIQSEFPERIARHLLPTHHMNLFSDMSLGSLLYRAGFQLTAIWYLGLDAYELFVQLSLALGNTSLFERCGSAIERLQESFDRGRLCDIAIIAAVPRVRPPNAT